MSASFRTFSKQLTLNIKLINTNEYLCSKFDAATLPK